MADGRKDGRKVHTHGVSGYRAGCHCTVCTLAESERKRNYRATGSGAARPAAANVTPLRRSRPKTSARASARAPHPPSPEPVIGENEAAVRAQCAAASRAADQPGTVAQAITLSKVLDNPELVAIHANVSRQLHVLLQSLAGPRLKSAGRLEIIKQMQNRRPHGPNGEAAHGE